MFGWKKRALLATALANSAQDEVERLTAEVREVSGANGRLAADLDSRDITIRGLTEENATLRATLSAAKQAADSGVSS